jgi:hypothetical protein
MKQPPRLYNTLNEALDRLKSRLNIPLKQWMDAGFLLKQSVTQRKITDFM